MQRKQNASSAERALRRKARQSGLALRKCRDRSKDSACFGTYQIIDPATNTLVLGDSGEVRGFGRTLEECDEYLSR